ncbi:hypothetical protein GLOIN_2v1770557 [Rhizophagus irregularis DAOM 181602=DAOM 197198]|uniref:Uncharacterized protein n=2 Tax=Rhizophagus irregularis TaxID=588596 RepID=A0A2P4QC14_RHIID|nr:hypothetical protein GLOIN_2v1770557 [Rhizophagus irregularis DAOM 181602=DAOM 197198]POG75180.1 hypothetical protein GLOIN_2v1770557 [Rhizophagus irregularis DAOM 181602=DAOM 197198]|eukprot:XP_025182046.1 hypothetical protein GLOIN_2v1770557 [Rhizophagus irregularis DAOM 181602=DAOM 197198]
MPINSNTRNIRNAPLVSNTRNVPSAPATRSTANKSWKSNTKSNKKEAKEEVATLVMRVLEKVGSQKTGISKNMRLIDQTPEVVKWYNTERMRTLPKPMQVLLLELCQKYGFSYPRFHQKSGSNNKLTYITCKVNQKSWEPDTSFSKRSDAKDHVATHTFNSLFLKIQIREEEKIKKENELIKDQCAQLKRRN